MKLSSRIHIMYVAHDYIDKRSINVVSQTTTIQLFLIILLEFTDHTCCTQTRIFENINLMFYTSLTTKTQHMLKCWLSSAQSLIVRTKVVTLPVSNVSTANHRCQVDDWIPSHTCLVEIWVLANQMTSQESTMRAPRNYNLLSIKVPLF